jgi:pyrrolidone-carboxylate peptidase
LIKGKSKSSKLFKLLVDNDIPAQFSKDADRFICNALGYYISAAARTTPYVEKTLFVHTAWTTDYKDLVEITNDKNFLPTELYYKGLELLIRNI